MVSGGRELSEKRLREIGQGSFFKARDAEALGVGFRDLQRSLEAGSIEQVARGLYRLADAKPTEHYSLAAVCARAPNAIVCLLSALSVHEIGTELAREVWIGIGHKARAPKIPEFPTRVVRFSGPSLRYGVVSTHFEGVPARITSPARTVVDCFRFRRLVGYEAAREALREALRERKATVDEIWRAAEMCRAKSLVGPVLEAMTG